MSDEYWIKKETEKLQDELKEKDKILFEAYLFLKQLEWFKPFIVEEGQKMFDSLLLHIEENRGIR